MIQLLLLGLGSFIVVALLVLVGLKIGLKIGGSFLNFLMVFLLFALSVVGTVALYHPHILYFLYFLAFVPSLFGAVLGIGWKLLRGQSAQ
ncbi:MAG: hypothetical protein Q7S09_00765 [bacterium]|nr:hypothetical protein [bacterium]